MSGLGYWEEKRVERESEQVPDVTADIELSMNKFFFNTLEGEEQAVKTQRIVVPPLNPTMLYTISLHQHAVNVAEIIKLNEDTKNPEKIELKMPQLCKTSDNETNLNFTPEDFRNFTKGNEVEVCELSKTVVHQILKKCIATMFAHIGFETGQQSALDVLNDILQEFFRKICHHVKVAIDDKETQEFSGFPHIIERVLTEIGMGGVKTLNDYYQSRVIKYVDVLENRCQDLHEEYHTLLLPKSPSPVDKINKIVRVKVEEEDIVEIENPEVHFSTIDGDVNFSILETGYQLLNSLEAEANLQSMGDSVEDITVGESSGVVSMASDDISHLAHFNKKKRFK